MQPTVKFIINYWNVQSHQRICISEIPHLENGTDISGHETGLLIYQNHIKIIKTCLEKKRDIFLVDETKRDFRLWFHHYTQYTSNIG